MQYTHHGLVGNWVLNNLDVLRLVVPEFATGVFFISIAYCINRAKRKIFGWPPVSFGQYLMIPLSIFKRTGTKA